MEFLYKVKTFKWRLWGPIIILFLLLLPINIFLSTIFSICNMEHQSLKFSTWHYRHGQESSRTQAVEAWNEAANGYAWHEVKEVGNSIGNGKSNLIYYKTTLPNKAIRDACLLFQTNDHAFEIYVDKNRIYTYGNYDQFNYRNSPGSPIHFISLPEAYENKELIIAMKAVSKSKLGLIRTIELDTKSNHILGLFKMNISNLVLASLNVVIGTFCALFSFAQKNDKKALVSLGLSFVIAGLWSISENPLTQMLYFHPKLWYYVAIISFYLIPVTTYQFIKDITSSNKYIYGLMVQLHILLFVISLALDLTGLQPFITTLIYHYILLGISYTACVILGIGAAMGGNKIAATYTLGFFLFGATGLYDILGWYFEILPWKTNVTPWGMFGFQLSLVFALIVYLQVQQARFLLFKEKIKDNNIKLKEKEKQIDQVMEQDKIKTEFFANMSHELRTPLNIISSTIQLIKMYHAKGVIAKNEVAMDKYIGIMNQNCNRLVKLVDNIIDMTKMESGYYKLDLRRVDIVRIVEETVLSVEAYAVNRGLKLTFDTNVEEKMIACDPDAIERILLNLLSNAIKFSDFGGEIEVVVKDEGRDILIEVTDTGMGVPPDKKDKIFERFAQVDKSFTRQSEGSGIGLAIVKSLVELHKGNIILESELNIGSKFSIRLPAEQTGAGTLPEQVELITSKLNKVSIELSDL